MTEWQALFFVFGIVVLSYLLAQIKDDQTPKSKPQNKPDLDIPYKTGEVWEFETKVEKQPDKNSWVVYNLDDEKITELFEFIDVVKILLYYNGKMFQWDLVDQNGTVHYGWKMVFIHKPFDKFFSGMEDEKRARVK